MQLSLKSSLAFLLIICIGKWSATAANVDKAEQAARKLARIVRQQPNAATNPCGQGSSSTQLWPQNIIPYKYSDRLKEAYKVTLQKAMQAVEQAHCVRFVPWIGPIVHLKYAQFDNGQSCCTHKGMVVDPPNSPTPPNQHVYVHSTCTSNMNDAVALMTRLAGISLNTSSTSAQGTTLNRCRGLCGNSLLLSAKSKGTIRSPGYPQTNYPPKSKCAWKLWTHAGTKLQLRFTHFKLEDEACNFDYVEIAEQNITGTVIKRTRHCGSTPFTLNSTAAIVTVQFYSDDDIQKQGFNLNYTSHPPDIIGGENHSGECSINNGGCEHICNEESGLKTKCSCQPGFQLMPDGLRCNDINECAVNKGSCEQRCKNTVGSYYCHCGRGYGLSSNGRSCYECGGTLNVSEGVITSPAYPSPYPPKQNCEWKIYIHPDHYLNVTLTNVDILGDQTDKCRDTHVKPYDSNFRFNRRLCGHYKRITYLVKRSGTYSRVRFRTFDNNGRGTGFSLHFRQVRINELINQELNYVKIDTKTIPYGELWT